MNFTMLVYLDEKAFAALPPDEQNRVHRACTEWHEGLVRCGHSQGCNGLQDATSARTLRRRNGQLAVTDGPFAETKEVLGGFESLQCRDLDEALAIAARFPGLDWGITVEVRPGVPGNECRA
jgi:hypothetical protein